MNGGSGNVNRPIFRADDGEQHQVNVIAIRSADLASQARVEGLRRPRREQGLEISGRVILKRDFRSVGCDPNLLAAALASG
jgi:hypothetical protein